MEEIQLMKQRSKYVLWYNRNFRPILTHQELLPIMEDLGFVMAVGKEIIKVFEGIEVPWIEYKYRYHFGDSLTSKAPPTPQLPLNYIDGLHLYTYFDFLLAIDFYLGRASQCAFHVRGIPANLDDPDIPHWTYAEQCGTLVRRRGTLDTNLLRIYSIENAGYYMSELVFPERAFPKYPKPKITMVAIDDIVVNTVTGHQDKNSNRPGGGEGKEP